MTVAGGGLPTAAPGGQPFQFNGEPYALDPSVAPGLPRPVGWRVHLPDGTAAWDKFGTGDTDWAPIGTGGGGSGQDPFSLMAGRAQAFGNALAPAVDFSKFDPFVEDFPANSVDTLFGAGGGAVSFSTKADPLESNGRMKVRATGAATNKYALATCAGNVGFIGEVRASAYYVEWKVRIKEAAANVNTIHAVGIVQATGGTTALDANPFVIFGLCGNGSVVPTKWGAALFNGPAGTFAVTPSTVNADLTGTVDHYLGIGHDPTTNLFFFYVDGTQVLSLSDVIMGANVGPGPYTYLAYDQDSAAGFTDADKVFMVTT